MIRFENVFDPQRVSEPQPVVSATNGGPRARFQGRARQRRIRERDEAVPAERSVPALQCQEQIREVPTTAWSIRSDYGGALSFRAVNTRGRR